MSEELERSGLGVGEGDQETGQPAEPTADASEARQPEQPQPSKEEQRRINLDDMPEFRQWKSRQDKQLAELRQRAEAAERAAKERMTHEERIRYEQEQAQQELETLRQQLQEQQQLNEWIMFVEDIRSETGAPLEALDQSSVPNLIRSAYAWQVQNEREKIAAQARNERQTANAVDTGSGSSPDNPQSRWQREYDEARKNGDTLGMLRIVDEAEADGVILNAYTPPTAR